MIRVGFFRSTSYYSYRKEPPKLVLVMIMAPITSSGMKEHNVMTWSDVGASGLIRSIIPSRKAAVTLDGGSLGGRL